MKSNYKRLGDYIQIVDIRNKKCIKENLLGVSVSKSFITSIANTVGTDFSKYTEYDPKSDESYLCIHYSTIPYEESNDINKGYFSTHDIKRDEPILIKVVEELGEAAAGRHAKLKIVEIPDGVVWELDEYDGMESIDEVHQSWD